MPRFLHDCQDCRFCGNVNGEDIYLSCEDSVIRRFGDNGEDYKSFPLAMAKLVGGEWKAIAAFAENST